MLTLGVDLAAADERTALAVVEWRDGESEIQEVRLGVDDDAILAALAAADHAGIDSPFGWPVPFAELVAGHAAGPVKKPGPGESSAAWRRRLVYRLPDEVVRAETGLIPLSVSADRIALPTCDLAELVGQAMVSASRPWSRPTIRRPARKRQLRAG